MKNKNINIYLFGKKLYGDDFNISQIEEWYNDEKEAYANLGAKNLDDYKYMYHELNKLLAYDRISIDGSLKNCLSIGGAWGHELFPIINKCNNITIIEPSDHFKQNNILRKPLKYVKPNISGILPFDDFEFDLITCLGTLHHIPNVTTVLKETYRVAKKGGIIIIREPIVSLGDWTKPRKKGVTKRERGIPLNLLHEMILKSKFQIISEQLCIFGPIAILGRKLEFDTYNKKFIVRIDNVLS